MKHLRYILLLLLSAFIMPIQAQVETDNIDSDEDDAELVDSAMIDSLRADTVAIPWPENVQQRLTHLLQSKMFETSQVGMMVWDLDADSCLFSHNEKQLMRPASCMKLVTAITAIDKLGGSYQFKTQMRYTGNIEEGVLKGDIYCVGGMDPRFNNDDMSALVSSLKEMGVDSIAGNIYADKTMKVKDKFGWGWCWDDKNYVLTPLLILRKDEFMERFFEKLKDADIKYEGSDSLEARCPSDAYTITTRVHTIDQVLSKMMKESNNLYAESMYYQIAASTGEHPCKAQHARNVEKQLISKIGLDPKRYKLADGSGLSLYNYLSAELLTKLLRYAARNENVYTHLWSALPIAGVDGTLKKRMKGSFTKDNVRAKTGTLTGVITLSGYCTAANGHRLCFSIMNQGIMHGNNAREFQDRVCTALCQP